MTRLQHQNHCNYNFVSSTGKYDISEAEGVQRGTKIVIHLKGDCYDYAKEDIVKGRFLLISILEMFQYVNSPESLHMSEYFCIRFYIYFCIHCPIYCLQLDRKRRHLSSQQPAK